jgi:hypothetical protein
VVVAVVGLLLCTTALAPEQFTVTQQPSESAMRNQGSVVTAGMSQRHHHGQEEHGNQLEVPHRGSSSDEWL